MNVPDADPAGYDEQAAKPADSEPDDVEGHRMLTPDQAQQRSDTARVERERRLAGESKN